MMGFTSPMPAFRFVNQLNKVYELQLEFSSEITVRMPLEQRSLDQMALPQEVTAGLFSYMDEMHHQLYMFVQMPRFQAKQGELLPTDPLLAYDKLLFAHGELAFGWMDYLYEDLSDTRTRVLDICDRRASDQEKCRRELMNEMILHFEKFDFRPKRKADKDDPWAGMVIVHHTHRSTATAPQEPKPARKGNELPSDMATLGQRILSAADTFYHQQQCRENALKQEKLPNINS